MARGVNKVILVGNLGNDPEVKYTQGGMAITKVSMATSSVRKDKDGNQQEKTEWHRVKLFGKLGEIAGEYLKKGRSVYIEGRLEYGSYEKDGVKHYTTDIVADEMQMLGGGDGQRVAIAGIRQLIEVHHPDAVAHRAEYEIAADESGAAGDQPGRHAVCFLALMDRVCLRRLSHQNGMSSSNGTSSKLAGLAGAGSRRWAGARCWRSPPLP